MCISTSLTGKCITSEKEEEMDDLKKAKLFSAISTILKIIFLILFLFPFWVLVVTSFKTHSETIANTFSLLPRKWSLEGYRYFLFDLHINVWTYLKNSIIITFTLLILQFIVMIPAAYAFAKHNFYFNGPLFGLVLISFMMPIQVTFISVYMMMAKAGLMNTYWPQILPFVAYAFGIFLLRQNFKQVPEEIIESARLDGASEAKLMLKIVTPMAKATLVTVALFSFVTYWNAYFWPLVMTQSDSVRPLSLMVKQISTNTGDGEGVHWNAVMASNLILVAPIVIMYIFANKRILKSYGYRGLK